MPEQMAILAQQAAPETCDHAGAVLYRVRGVNGALRCFTMWCDGCKSHAAKAHGFPGIWIGKADPKLAHIDPESVPWLLQEQYWRQCEGPCGALALCECHHLAPHKFFTDADEWPTAWLCKACHDRWHTVLTPGLCTEYSAETHANLLRNYLGREKFSDLCRALGPLYRKDHASEAAD